MSERKTYVILGLGRFGTTLAKQLTDFNQDVIAVDKEMVNVDRVSQFLSNAFCLDYSDIDALKSIGVSDADVAIVTTGTMIDQGIQGIINLKELGVPYVLAKAPNLKIANILKKIGADDTITPENDMAVRCAKKLISKDILELFDVDNDHTMFEMKVQPNWIGHSLIELDLRSKLSINVIGVKRDEKLIINVDPNEKFNENDEVLIVGPNDIFKHFTDLNNV